MSVEAAVIALLVEDGTPEGLAYLGGAFDGEGCVKLYAVKRGTQQGKFRCELQVSNNDKRLPQLFFSMFGGTLHREKSGSGNEIWVWRATGPNAEKTANALLNYTVVKHEQLRLFLKFRTLIDTSRRGYRPLTGKEVQARHTLAAKIAQLKKGVAYVG